VPEIVANDAQVRHCLDGPALLAIEPADPAAGGGVLDAVLPVPDQPADVELVFEDAGAAPPADILRRIVKLRLPPDIAPA
jgi:hypothetical protein